MGKDDILNKSKKQVLVFVFTVVENIQCFMPCERKCISDFHLFSMTIFITDLLNFTIPACLHSPSFVVTRRGFFSRFSPRAIARPLLLCQDRYFIQILSIIRWHGWFPPLEWEQLLDTASCRSTHLQPFYFSGNLIPFNGFPG